MSIKVIDLQPHLTEQAKISVAAILTDVDSDPANNLKHFVQATMSQLARYNENGVLDFPELDRFSEVRQEWKLGRIGLREITSPWAKAQFPHATRELVITMIDIERHAVHVYLVFL